MSELRGLQLSIEELRATGAELVAVSVDPPERNAEVARRLGIDFPLLSDPDAATIRAFGVLHEGGSPSGDDIARPAIFLIENGQVRWKALTDNWRVRPRAEDLVQIARRTFAGS